MNVRQRGVMFAAALVMSTIATLGVSRQPAAAQEDEGGCLQCASGSEASCPEDYHVAENGSPEWNRRGGSHPDTCWSGTCTSKHGTCWGETLAQELQAAIDTRNAAALVALIETQAKVSLNESRASIQVRGCTTAIEANFSVPPSLMTEIAALRPEGVRP